MKAALFATALLLSGSATLAIGQAAPADAAKGLALYRARCAVCHGADSSGGNGPDLHGIVGRSAASEPDFAYSAALRRSGKTWSAAELQAFLVRPQAAVPGTRMAFAGAQPAEAAALIAYLKTLK
ncbi:c-type cytochrome [soil metagenome]